MSLAMCSLKCSLHKTLVLPKVAPPLKYNIRHKVKSIHRYNNPGITFSEVNRKGTLDNPPMPPIKDVLKGMAREFVPESKKWIKEMKNDIIRQPLPESGLNHGSYEVVYRFDKKEHFNQWIVTADSMNNEGFSTANFSFSKNRTGLFHGVLNTQVPEDGVVQRTGYVNISTKRPMKSFHRETSYDWSDFNCFLIRCRGDGRAYNIIIQCDYYYDLNWLKRYTFPLFTRGGPYWQVAKIPFSKLYLSFKGRKQDKQGEFPTQCVQTIGFTLADGTDGPYYLELDSIALMYDVNLTGIHAYETYLTNVAVG